MRSDSLARFLAAMAAAGLHPRERIAGPLASGRLVRFRAQGDGVDQSGGWALLHLGQAVPSGAFGHYRLGIHESWCADRTGELAPQLRRGLARIRRESRGQPVEQLKQVSPCRAR
jgi:hypothetical protein